MICPNCGSSMESKVVDTRERKTFTFRKRACTQCGFIYITHEEFVKPCAEWVFDKGPVLLPINRIPDYQEALWIETKAYGGNMLFATSIHDVGERYVKFDNGQVRAIGLYGKQWRAWTRRPSKDDLKHEWRTEE